jgi:hypothetical protein
MAEHVHHHPPHDLVRHGDADDQYLETPPGSGYEHTDASVGVLVQFAIWLIVSAIIVHVGLAGMYWFLIRQSAEPAATKQYPIAVNEAPRLPPEPRLQRSGSSDLYDFRTKEEMELHSYGWVDKNAGVVHIPIDDAMRLMLQRGMPSREQDPSKANEPLGMMPSDSSSGRVLEKRRQ